MKFISTTTSILLLFTIVCSVNGRGLSLFRRLSRDAKENSEDSPSVFSPFETLADDLGLRNLFREAQIRVLGVTEQLLDQTGELYDNFQDVVKDLRNSSDTKSSELRKALRYLKTEARRRKEDIEDEIEIEKERAAAAEDPSEKEDAEENIKNLTDGKKKLDKIIKKKIPKKRSSGEDTTVTAASLIKSKKSKQKTEKSPKKSEDKEEEALTPPAVMSLGDGFGRHS